MGVDEGDERRLVEAARAGDRQAWETLYRRVYPRLRAYLARRVGNEHAEDLVSETMTRAVTGIDRLTVGPAGFDGWIFGIARHVSVDHHRQSARRRQDRVLQYALATGPSPQPPDERLVVEDDRARVRRLFERLDPAHQEVLELRVVAGLSAEQAAAVLGKRPGAVRTAQSRALGALRKLVEDDDG